MLIDVGGANDRLLLGGMLPARVNVQRDGSDLSLRALDSTDVITVRGFFTESANEIESVVFDDGTVWNSATLKAKASVVTLNGTSGSDTLVGSSADEVINGLAGSDTLWGAGGSDTLVGGTGSDTYAFGLGDGLDVIQEDEPTPGASDLVYFTGNLKQTDVSFQQNGNDLEAVIKNSTDKLVLQDWYLGSRHHVESFFFAGDGSTLLESQMPAAAPSGIYGTAGDDALTGTDGADTMYGLAGDDTLQGGLGNDRYGFATGDGQDSIIEAGGAADGIVFGTGIQSSSVTVQRSGGDLVLSISGTDRITVQGHFSDAAAEIESVSFSDGTVWDGTTLRNMASSLYGTSGDDRLTGSALPEALYGLAGNDTLDGGLGADTLTGGLGDDVYFVNDAGDVVIENASEGNDLVNASLSWNLAANLENLTLTGSGAINGTGNAVGNRITGNGAANTLTGAGGNDTLQGGLGDDTYRFSVSDGQDLVVETGGANDRIVWSGGQASGNVAAQRIGSDLKLSVIGGTDAITVQGFFNGSAGEIEAVQFDDGTTWSAAELERRATALNGTAGSDTLAGAAGDQLILGFSGSDTLYGGTGNDTMAGGSGADTYGFAAGDGVDTIQENDASAGVNDLLYFVGSTRQGDVQFQRNGNDLEALIRNTADKVVVQDWYLGSAHHVESFYFAGDNTTLTDTQVQNLVSAMAGFGAQQQPSSMSAGFVEGQARTTNHVLAVNALA